MLRNFVHLELVRRILAAPARSRSQPDVRYPSITPDSHSGRAPGFRKAHAWSGSLQCTRCLQDGSISQMAPGDTTVGRTPIDNECVVWFLLLHRSFEIRPILFYD